MDSRPLLAFCTVCAAGALALRIGSRARRSDLDALLLGLLAAVAVWAGGVGAWSGNSDFRIRHVAVMSAFLGVFAAIPLWLIFALRASRARWLVRFPALPVLVALPSVLAVLALLTNSAHHGMLREGVQWTEAVRAFAGPLMMAYAVIVIASLLATAGVLLAWAWRLRRRPEVHRASLVALAVAALLPIAGAVARLFLGASTVHAVFPASLMVSVLLLAVGPLRDHLQRGVTLSHRDVFDQLRDGVLIANARGAVADANPAAARLLGCARSQLCGRDLAEVIAGLATPECSSALRRELEDLAASRAPLRLDVALRDGRRLEVRASCVGDAGEVLGRYALLRDRTGERRFAEAARRAQKLETVATLAGGVAHEVSNPLAFVRANLAEIDRLGAAAERHLAEGPSPLASELVELRGLAKEALEGIARIERIAAGMRRLSTAGEGFATVELAPVVDEAVQLARIRFAEPLDVELRLDPELPSVRGAPALLVQALLHLLVAAQRGASACGGSIRVRGERAGEAVVVRIGCGRDAAAHAADHAESAPGDDPGLPIARDIARDHGGELEVAGPPGAPTALALRLPLAEGAA